MADGEISKIRRYRRGDRLHVQAQQIWLILVGFVMFQARVPGHLPTMTYGELALLMGFETKQAGHMLGRQLGIIGLYCLANDLPPLNVVVVNQETRVPGDEVVLTKRRNLKADQKDVLEQDWFEVGPPTTGALRAVWESIGK